MNMTLEGFRLRIANAFIFYLNFDALAIAEIVWLKLYICLRLFNPGLKPRGD